MRIISRRTLIKGKEKHPGASIALDVWYSKARAPEWGKPTDLLADFNNARTIENNRAIFNLNKNDFRLVVKIHYNRGIIYIRFFGTHAAYDKIDSLTI